MAGKFIGNAIVLVIGFLMVVLVKQPAWLKFVGLVIMLLPLLTSALQSLQESRSDHR